MSDTNNTNALNAAETLLLRLVRAGDADGWRQFVNRYEQRLFAFALGRLDQSATAQDLVQETFIGFLQSMNRFQGNASLESFLFRILRRRIVDHYRSRGQHHVVHACEIGDEPVHLNLENVPSKDTTASRYVHNEEQIDAHQNALSVAIGSVTNELRESHKFRDLKIAEGLFYAGLRNQKLAELISIAPNEVAVVKHRLLQRLNDQVCCVLGPVNAASERIETDLITAWEVHRPSCPKRSTLRRYTLGILPPPWQDFVSFHVETLGCRYCLANLTELKSVPTPNRRDDRLFQSTIGFLKPTLG